MPTFRVCDRLISFDYPTSLAECTERILSLAAQIKILDRTGQKEAAILADCELAMLHEWQNSSYLLTMMSVRNCSGVSESKLKEEGALVRHMQSVLLRLQKQNIEIGEEAKVICQYAREWLASKGCQEIPPEYLIPDKFKVQDSAEAVKESKLVMAAINNQGTLTQLGKALQAKISPQKTVTPPKDVNLSNQIDAFTKCLIEMDTKLNNLEAAELQQRTVLKNDTEASLQQVAVELQTLQSKINDLEELELDRIETTLTSDQIKELVSTVTISNGASITESNDSARLMSLLKKYQDEIKALSTSRKDRLSKLEKKLESLSGFVEVERNVRMAQYKATISSVKTLKQACQFLTQAPVDTNKQAQVELMLSTVGVSSSNFSNKQATSQPQLVTELTLFN
ncbi:hypothetical protein NIES4071_104950 (plasmid) [Calothrix sp. NIES-4071]|nr:hypothetical protein NIES4071_104950 [Calothrix sp. NIES-4071]BAZ64913.1 hypothetical protein NIES4105_106460 [Calothrix sp. NIES-4105]